MSKKIKYESMAILEEVFVKIKSVKNYLMYINSYFKNIASVIENLQINVAFSKKKLLKSLKTCKTKIRSKNSSSDQKSCIKL